MSILDVVAGVVAGPASRVVEAPVRDIVDQVLRKQDLARPEDVAALRGEVTRLTQELAAMQARLGDLLGSLEGLQAETSNLRSALASAQSAPPAPAATAPASEEPPAPVKEAPAPVVEAPAPKKKAPAPKPPQEASAPKKRGRKSLAHLGCKIEGCEDEHRSKGFCAKHYQAWRRGNLDGFVGPEGLIGHEGGAWQVDQKHAGKAATVDTSGKRAKVLVEGKSVRAKKIA